MDKMIIKGIRNAIKQGDANSLRNLINEHPEALNEMTPFGTWLHVAAKRGLLEIVEYLVEKGLDVNTNGGTFDASALNVASLGGDIETVKYLIGQGAVLDVSLAKRNPLFSVIQGGHMDVARCLVENRIGITVKYNTENLNDIGAYEFAVEYGQTEIANYLKEKLEQ